MKKIVPLSLSLLILASVIFAASACVKDKSADMNASQGEKRYLALGDSYTIGQSVPAQERFPAQTVKLLRDASVKISDPEYIAVTGWTTIDLTTAINSTNPKGSYDVVSLLIGVNDQYRGMDTAGYRVRFEQLLRTSVQLAGSRPERVFVLSIPDYSATPFVDAASKARVRAEIDQFNVINRQITLSNSIAYIDITPSTRQALSNPLLVANDGLHPSGAEYKKWAEMLAPEILKVLR